MRSLTCALAVAAVASSGCASLHLPLHRHQAALWGHTLYTEAGLFPDTAQTGGVTVPEELPVCRTTITARSLVRLQSCPGHPRRRYARLLEVSRTAVCTLRGQMQSRPLLPPRLELDVSRCPR